MVQTRKFSPKIVLINRSLMLLLFNLSLTHFSTGRPADQKRMYIYQLVTDFIMIEEVSIPFHNARNNK